MCQTLINIDDGVIKKRERESEGEREKILAINPLNPTFLG